MNLLKVKKAGIIKPIIAILIPIIGVMIMLLINRVNMSDISISCSRWNDEVAYYKTLEGIINGGPFGKWGYNGSYSVYGNFSAWNPSVYFFLIIWSKLFGLSYVSPIYLNIFLWGLAFFIFERLCKPSIKQLLFSFLVFCSFSMGIRYIFSITPEATIGALFLIYCSLMYKINESYSKIALVFSMLILVFLIMVRGYFAAFGFAMIIILWKEKRIKSSAVQISIILASVVSFFLAEKYLSASFFTDTSMFGWLFNKDIFISSLKEGYDVTYNFVYDALVNRNSIKGSWYLCYIVLGIAVLVVALKKRNLLWSSIVVIWLGLFAAMWLMYTPREGSRCLMDIVIVGGVFLPLFFTNAIEQVVYTVLVSIIFVLLTWKSFYTDLPIKDEEICAALDNTQLDKIMPLASDSWDNTVACSLDVRHNELYALPTGFGINFCYDEYILDNLDDLLMKYIYVGADTSLDNSLMENGIKCIAEYGDVKIYQAR